MKPLTQRDRETLRMCVEHNENPLRLIHIGGYVSHYRFGRLLERGLAKTIPPRLTEEAVTIAKAEPQGGAEK